MLRGNTFHCTGLKCILQYFTFMLGKNCPKTAAMAVDILKKSGLLNNWGPPQVGFTEKKKEKKKDTNTNLHHLNL